MKVKVRPGLWLLVSIVFMMSMGATLFVWTFQRGHETQRSAKLLLSASETLQDRVQAELDRETNAVQRLAAKWQVRPDLTREEWEYDVRLILEDHPSLLSLAWLPSNPAPGSAADPRQVVRDWRVTWSLPAIYEPAVIKLHDLVQENRSDLLQSVVESRRTRITDAIQVADRCKAFAAYVPSIAGGELKGAVMGVFHLQILMDSVFDRLLATDFSIQLMDGYQQIYSRGLGKNQAGDWEHQGTMKIFGSSWKMRLWPNPELQQANERLAGMLLIGGVALSFLLSGLVLIAARRGEPGGRVMLPELRGEAAESRRKMEERQRVWEAAIANSGDAILVAEAEKVMGSGPLVLFVNEAFTQLTGYAASEIVGKTPKMLIGSEDLRGLMGRDEAVVLSLPIWNKASAALTVELRAKPVRDAQNNATHWVFALKKIETPAVAANPAALLQSLLADTPLAVQVVDAEGLVLNWNALAESVTGWTAEEVVGKPSPIAVKTAELGSLQREDLKLKRKQGLRMDLAVWTAALRDREKAEEPVTRWMSFMLDQTTEHLAQEELGQREASFRALLEHASDVLAVLDLDSTFKYINPAVQQVLGFAPDQLIGAPATALLDAQHLHPADAVLLQLHHRDGGLRELETTIRPIAGTSLTMLSAHSKASPTSLLDALEDAIITYDTEYRVSWMNRAAEEVYGFTAVQAKGKTLSEVQPDWLQVPGRDQIRQALEIAGAWKGEISNYSPGGREIVQDVSITVTKDAEGRPTGAVAIHRDITAKKPAVDALAVDENTKTLNALGTSEGLWDWNLSTDEVYFSPRWKEMLGYADEEITGDLAEWYMLVHPDDLALLRNKIANYLKGQMEHLEAEYRARTRSGHYRWMTTRAIAMRNQAGEATRLVGLQTDIHAQKDVDEQLLFEAFHDSVTGLANRALFLDRLNGLLAHPDQAFAVAFVDLEQFAQVNEAIGTRGGDEALREIGRRIAESLPPGSFVARHGSDEFVAVVSTADWAKLEAFRALLGSRLAKPFAYAGKELSFPMKIGYATSIDSKYRSGEEMLQAASRAMAATRNLSAPKAASDPGTELQRALAADEFRVFYHPVVELDSGEIIGVEALIRWQHPERGLLTPGDFLDLAETTGWILELDRWMLREACAKALELNTKYRRAEQLVLTVNLSSLHFRSGESFRALEEIIGDSGIDASYLQIELNECADLSREDFSVILKNLGRMQVQLNMNRDRELLRIPADRIKLPPKLVRGLATGRNIEKAREIIGLARRQNLQVVAEGVETLEQLAVLRELKCHLAQGFYFTKPASAMDTEKLLARGPRW